MQMLERIELKGYKSIREASLELRPLNVLIGANGSGKSNLISFFKLLSHVTTGNLQGFVATSGGANSLLHYGAKVTPQVDAALHFRADAMKGRWQIRLAHAAEDTLLFTEQEAWFERTGGWAKRSLSPRQGRKESELPLSPVDLSGKGFPDPRHVVASFLSRCRVFQFHDTSSTASIRQKGDINQNVSLMGDGGNLAAVLYKIQQTQADSYQRIVGTIRQIAPFFGDFNLAPSALNADVIQLRWKERDRDYDFGPHLLSDGTLRAMALVVLLLQPTSDLPSVIIIDEPELGLHPYAIATLAGLLRSASEHSQILVATESATLLDHFEPQEVIVTERCMGETSFKRLDSRDLQEWREEYCLSELWDKNVIGGRPSR
jgi:predicted ATPase